MTAKSFVSRSAKVSHRPNFVDLQYLNVLLLLVCIHTGGGGGGGLYLGSIWDDSTGD